MFTQATNGTSRRQARFIHRERVNARAAICISRVTIIGGKKNANYRHLSASSYPREAALTHSIGGIRIIPIIPGRFPSICKPLFSPFIPVSRGRSRSTLPRCFPSTPEFIRLRRNRLVSHKKYIKNNYAHDYGYVIRETVPSTNTASDCENEIDGLLQKRDEPFILL